MPTKAATRGLKPGVLAGGLVLAAFLVYGGTLSAPFLQGELAALLGSDPSRPMAKLTLEANFALGGDGVEGYHLVNILIHALAGLALFGIVRRIKVERVAPDALGTTPKSANASGATRSTLEPGGTGGPALPAFGIALIWLLHPLQTEAVNDVAERSELLAGLCYFFAIYCFVRAPEGGGRREAFVSLRWRLLAVISCLVGFGCNVRVYPLFPAFSALPHDLHLLVRPERLVFGQGEPRMYLLLAPLVAIPILWLRRLVGPFVWLPAVVWAVVLGGTTRERNRDYRSELALWGDTVAKRPNRAAAHANLAGALYRNGRTEAAVAEYRTALQGDSENGLIHYDLGLALADLDRLVEAQSEFEEALRLNPEDAAALDNLGLVLSRLGRMPEAIGLFQQALHSQPDDARIHGDLGYTLAETGRLSEAIDQFHRALRLRPDYSRAQAGLAQAEEALADAEAGSK